MNYLLGIAKSILQLRLAQLSGNIERVSDALASLSDKDRYINQSLVDLSTIVDISTIAIQPLESILTQFSSGMYS